MVEAGRKVQGWFDDLFLVLRQAPSRPLIGFPWSVGEMDEHACRESMAASGEGYGGEDSCSTSAFTGALKYQAMHSTN
jgi:hypothetical protein